MMTDGSDYSNMMGSFGVSTGTILILILIGALIYFILKDKNLNARHHEQSKILEDEIKELKKEISELKKDKWKDF